MLNKISTSIAIFGLFFAFAATVFAQDPVPSPSPAPSQEAPESVKVFTEEVRLPVVALDQYGHNDPTVSAEDILVLEDGLAQQIRSVRRLPPNVLVLLDTGGELSGLGGQSKRTNLTRDIAIELVNKLRPDTSVSIIQFNTKVEMLQSWTTDKEAALKMLRTKLSSGKGDRFADAIDAAARALADRPEGSRHVVLITDGVDTGGKIDRAQAIKELIAARATVHILSYTEYVRQKNPKSQGPISAGQRSTSSDPIASTDPTLPPGSTRSPSYGVSVRFDPAMRKQRKAYEADVKKSQQSLITLADETGGRIFLPKTSEEMLAETRDLAQDIGAEYVVTYRPKRPLAEARQGEYRHVEVASRRVGLTLKSRRGYVVPTQSN